LKFFIGPDEPFRVENKFVEKQKARYGSGLDSIKKISITEL